MLLAPALADQEKLLSIVEDLYLSDALLGSEVAFILLHPEAENIVALNGLGRIPVLRGTTFPRARSGMRLPRPLRDTELFLDESSQHRDLRQEMARASARAMARFAPEFMDIFKIRPRELPALCVLVRGMKESVTVPLRAEWEKADLQEIFKQLEECAAGAREAGKHHHFLFDSVPRNIGRLQQSVQAIEAQTKKLKTMVDALLFRYQASSADFQIVAEYLSNQASGAAMFKSVLDQLSVSASDRFRKDGRIGKAQRMLEQIEKLREEFNAEQWGEYSESIAERVDTLVVQRARALESVRQIRNGRVVTTMNYTRKFEQAERNLSLIERFIGFSQKGVEVVANLKKLFQLAG